VNLPQIPCSGSQLNPALHLRTKAIHPMWDNDIECWPNFSAIHPAEKEGK
jgi:hypothetical protein